MLVHASAIHILPTDLNNAWCVYLLKDNNDAIQFIGISKLDRIYTIADAKNNPGFKQYFPDNKYIFIQMIDIAPNKVKALQKHSERMRQLPNIPMMMKYARYNKTLPIYCIETGETFKSLDEVARAHGVGAGNLSKHLRGVAGHRSIKGRTYCRINPNDPPLPKIF